jgi:hypothetical protein
MRLLGGLAEAFPVQVADGNTPCRIFENGQFYSVCSRALKGGEPAEATGALDGLAGGVSLPSLSLP